MVSNRTIREILLTLYDSCEKFVYLPTKKPVQAPNGMDNMLIDDSLEKTGYIFVVLAEAKLVATTVVGKEDTKPEDKQIFVRLAWKGIEAAKALKSEEVWSKINDDDKDYMPFDTLVDIAEEIIAEGLTSD